MSQNPRTLQARFRGALLGAATADALAFPHQHYSRAFLGALSDELTMGYTPHHSGFYPAGQYSDDTQMMIATVEAIVEAHGTDGPVLASHLVPLRRDNLLVEGDESCARAMERLVTGAADWAHSGLEPGHAEITPLARVVGPALWNHEHPERLADDVQVTIAITHTDMRVLACGAAAAAAIATNVDSETLVLGPFLDNMSEAAGRFHERLGAEILDFPRVLSMAEYRALRHFETLVADDRYAPADEGLSSYCVPGFWTAIYYFLKSPYDYVRCVGRSIGTGGHVDTTALLAGALVGSLTGESGVPQKLVAGLLNTKSIQAAADGLCRAYLSSNDVIEGDR